MSTPDLTPILEDLAAGRIDAAEASRRIEALKTQAPAPTASPTDSGSGDRRADATDRPEGGSDWKAYARETFSRDGDDAAPQESTAASADKASADQSSNDQASTNQASAGRPAAGGRADARDEVPASDRNTANAKGVDRVSIRAVGRRVRVVGDPRIATASVDGAHVLRRNGSVLEITSDGELGASIDGFTLLRPPRSLDDVRNLGLGRELFVRVNPNLFVDVELTAGSLTTEQVKYLGKVRVTAGGAKLSDVAEANDVLVQAGQATVKGKIATGRSRIRCESGSLSVQLDDDSNVTVRAEAQLGKVAWAGGHTGAGDEVVMGNGAARLDVGVVMGHATVHIGEDAEVTS